MRNTGSTKIREEVRERRVSTHCGREARVPRADRSLVASHNLPQLGKCGKSQKTWLANWLPHFAMLKEILSYFLNL